MKKRRRILYILFILFVLAMLTGIYAYLEFNRVNKSLLHEKAAFTLKADDLINEFHQNEEAAAKKYNGKILLVSGTVKKTEQPSSNTLTIILGNESTPSTVRCNIDSTHAASLLKKEFMKQQLEIKGVCTGYIADDSGLGIGSDVILNRCIIIHLK